MKYLLSLHRHNKHTCSHIDTFGSRPVVKLHGFFVFLSAKKPHRGGYV